VHVAVLGAGALGRIFGTRLATRGGVHVEFVVRDREPHAGARPIDSQGENVGVLPARRPIAIERVGGERVAGERLTLDAPAFVLDVPAHADVVLVCVRADQLDAKLLATLERGPGVPVVFLTPMLPHTRARMETALPGRVVTAMTSVTGYTNADGVTRHWISRSTKTLLDEARPPEPVVLALLSALAAAGIEGRVELGAHETSAATVIAVLPLMLAIDAAGSIDSLLETGPLLSLLFRAIKEARALAARWGRLPGWALALDRFLGPVTLRVGLALGRRRSAEIISFVEAKFGRAARGQNVVLAAEVLALAHEKGTPSASVRALAERLQ
jgi:2-dehydropantoate 2-reductase